jgi:hypothetical protein
MSDESPERIDSVTAPVGRHLTLVDLPSPQTERWVARRKAEVVIAVRGGLLSIEDACAHYTLTFEEFLTWERAYARFGLSGLRARDVEYHRLRKTKNHAHGT